MEDVAVSVVVLVLLEGKAAVISVTEAVVCFSGDDVVLFVAVVVVVSCDCPWWSDVATGGGIDCPAPLSRSKGRCLIRRALVCTSETETGTRQLLSAILIGGLVSQLIQEGKSFQDINLPCMS